MGFISALYDLGKIELSRHEDGEFSDIDSFLQMPADRIEVKPDDPKPKKLPAREIRVWLEVENPHAESLKILGIKDIDLTDYWSGNEDERMKKRRYLYRDAVSPAATWRYSPLYKLGAGESDGRKALIGEGGWKNDKDSRFYKLWNSTLRGFEEKGALTKGSVDALMKALEERVDKLAELWTEKKSSYLLIFCPYENDDFLYPVEVKSFLGYFRTRLAESVQSRASSKKSSAKDTPTCCGYCGENTQNPVNLDKIFAFATFDKKSFLPGLDDSEFSKAKVFPLCETCYKTLSEGRNILDNKFLDTQSIYGVRIYIVPELLIGNSNLNKVSPKTQDFIKTGLQGETSLSKKVSKQEDELIFHFVFWEKNQAQERLLLMVEDVPPTHLQRLADLWEESVKATRLFGEYVEEATSLFTAKGSPLDRAMKNIYNLLNSLAGKSEADAQQFADRFLDIAGKLLSSDPVSIKPVKGSIVSRLQGLCANPEWVAQWSGINARRMECVIDYLYRTNER